MREEQWEISESYLCNIQHTAAYCMLTGMLILVVRVSPPLSFSLSLFFVDSVNCTFLHSTLMTTKNGSNLWLKKKMQTVHSAGKDSTNQHRAKQFSSLTLISLSLSLSRVNSHEHSLGRCQMENCFLYKKFPFIAERLSMY